MITDSDVMLGSGVGVDSLDVATGIGTGEVAPSVPSSTRERDKRKTSRWTLDVGLPAVR